MDFEWFTIRRIVAQASSLHGASNCEPERTNDSVIGGAGECLMQAGSLRYGLLALASLMLSGCSQSDDLTERRPPARPGDAKTSIIDSQPGLPAAPDTDSPTVAATHLHGFAMGTTWSVTIVSESANIDATVATKAIRERLEELENQMSTWRTNSLLSRFNISSSTNWFPVTREVAYVVASAQDISAKSDGAFDVTVYPLVKLWGFGPDNRPTNSPTAATLARVRASVGWKNLQARQDPPALHKAVAELQIDLSAIAKGFAVDEVLELLKRMGVKRGLVEIGGEVRGIGYSAKNRPWRIGIEEPVADRRTIAEVAEVSDEALATSGDYRNSYPLGDERFTHVIDPRTGFPKRFTGFSASVRADTCAIADAWATALTVLGAEEGLAAARSSGLKALLLQATDGVITRQPNQWR